MSAARDRRKHGYRQVYIKCPFYRDYTPDVIRCEGIMDGTALSLSFGNRTDHDRHMDVFCQEKYQNCELYRMVMDARYEEDVDAQ